MFLHVTLLFFVFSLPADLGRNVILTSGCIVGACCQVNTCEVMPENTVVYGTSGIRRVQNEKPQVENPDICKKHGNLIEILNYWTIRCLLASNSAAGLPDEDPAQLPSPEEDRERKRHPWEKLKTSALVLTVLSKCCAVPLLLHIKNNFVKQSHAQIHMVNVQ